LGLGHFFVLQVCSSGEEPSIRSGLYRRSGLMAAARKAVQDDLKGFIMSKWSYPALGRLETRAVLLR
jgi:hypothetical protein